MMLIPAVNESPAVLDLARRLVAGEDVPHTLMHTTILAAGVTFADVERLCDRLAAEQDARHAVLSDLGRGGMGIPQF